MKPDPKKSSNAARPNGPGAGKGSSPNVSAKSPANEAEPTAGLAHTPIWLIILFAALFYWGQLYLDNHAGGFDPQVYEPYESAKLVKALNTVADDLAAKGEPLYGMVCAACHQPNGSGGALAPPLAGSEWVTAADPSRLIRIPLHGLSGPIQVKGQDYTFPSGMTAMGEVLSDDSLAAILSYIRQSWGNSAPQVTPAQVAKVRQDTANRPMNGTATWTADELLKVPLAQ